LIVRVAQLGVGLAERESHRAAQVAGGREGERAEVSRVRPGRTISRGSRPTPGSGKGGGWDSTNPLLAICHRA
jgi:hypothetical protein